MSSRSAAPWALRAWDPAGIAILAGLTILALGLRLHDYTLIPPDLENADEYAWAWSGLSLILKGSPTAWSYLWSLSSHYPAPTPTVINGRSFPLVNPWLDHPPVFSVLIGGACWLSGARDLGGARLEVIRLPAILLSTASVPLVAELGRRTVGWGGALAGAFLFAITPAAIVFSRMTESENLLVPILLGALILTDLHLTTGRREALAASLALCLLAPLVKVPGVAIGISVGLLLMVKGRARAGMAAHLAAITGFGLYALYGRLLGWDTFAAVLQANAARSSTLWGGYQLLVGAGGPSDRTGVHDGWWLAGLVALGAFVLRDEEPGARLLAIPVLVYVAFYALAGNIFVSNYGWYRWTIVPLVYLAAGALVHQSVREPSVAKLLVVGCLAGALTFRTLLLSSGLEAPPNLWVEAAAAALVMTPGLLAATRLRGLASPTALALMTVLLGVNGFESLVLTHTYPYL